MTTVPDDTRGGMDAMLANLWEKSRAGALQRVAVIEMATLTLRTGFLDRIARADAERAAHKLAGVAGTFGFWDATELAREAEIALEGNEPVAPSVVRRLEVIAAALRDQLSA